MHIFSCIYQIDKIMRAYSYGKFLNSRLEKQWRSRH